MFGELKNMINEVLISARQLLGWQMVFFTHKPDLRPNPPLSTLPQHEVSQILFFFKKKPLMCQYLLLIPNMNCHSHTALYIIHT